MRKTGFKTGKSGLKISIISLALALIASLAAFFGINFVKAHASGTVTASGSNVFTASGDATVLAHKADEDKFYTMFVLGFNADTVTYRRNLAYVWRESAEKEGLFNMEIGFETTSFDRYIIKFESQQYNKTKDNKTSNYIIFFPAEDGKVNALITADGDAELKEGESYVALDKDNITIEFTGREKDKFSVKVSNKNGVGEAATGVEGYFENIGGNYAKSSNSTTTPVYPLSFKAEFDNEESERETARMALYSLNGQSFILGYNKVNGPTADGLSSYYTHGDESGEYIKVPAGASFEEERDYFTFTELNKNTNDMYYGGTVYDDTAPVLCLEKDITYFTLGDEIDVDYAVIDVLRTSPSAKLNYYLLTYDMYVNAGDEPIADYNDKSLFKEITATDNIILETDTDKYLPNGAELDGTKFDAYTIGGTDTEGYFKAEMLAKVYMELTDVSSNAETSVVYLDWYVNDGYKINLADKADNASFIAVAKDKLGATYNYNGAYSMTWEQLKDEYQAQVNEAAKNLSAGSSSYMYLPSPEKLFADNATPYKDMRYGIYFYHKTQQSNTSLAYSNLSINISQPGEYVFTVYATDAASNNMYYLKALEGDKEKGKKYINIDGTDYEIVEFASSEIWNMFKDEDEEGLADYLPWFRFEVGYTGVTFEETPGLQSTAYVGTKYTSASFKINGITGSYDVTYRLFLFDRAAYYNGEGKTLTYQEFVDNMSALYGDASTQKYFKEIPALADMEETDEEYELYKDYGWDKGSTSFTPQDNNAFYMIRAEVTDKHMVSEPVTCELGVVASVTAKSLKGESDWLKNNVVSVVLLSIAGAALIGIVLLLVIKPKDKGDIDERFENAKKKSAKKNKK